MGGYNSSTVGEHQFGGGQYSASESLQYWAANHNNSTHHGPHTNQHQQQMRSSILPPLPVGTGNTLLCENNTPSPHSSPLTTNEDYANYANYNSTQWDIFLNFIGYICKNF